MLEYKKKREGAALMAALLPLLCALSACGGGDKPVAPEQYQIGEDTAPALALEEGVGELKKLDSTGDKEGEEPSYTYTYAALTEPGSVAGTYATLLTEGEGSFTVVDEDWEETDLPDFTQAEGSVRLAEPSAEEGKLLEIDLTWSEDQCVVTVTQPSGRLTLRPVEPMTLEEAINYVRGYTPEDLGLGGSSMSNYSIYPRPGEVLVDGNACLALDVYSMDNPGSTNHIMGTIFVTGDKAHIYHLDPESGSVKELLKSM